MTTTPISTRINLDSLISVSSNKVTANLVDEMVILDSDSGIYYGLNPVGSRIWELIQEPKTVKQVRDALLAEYDVEPERCENDILTLLQDLLTNELIVVQDTVNA